MASISTEALIGILLLILIITIFYLSLHAVMEEYTSTIKQKELMRRASSTAFLATAYSYSVAHGSFSPQLSCSIGESAVCKEEGRIVAAAVYKRQGGGN